MLTNRISSCLAWGCRASLLIFAVTIPPDIGAEEQEPLNRWTAGATFQDCAECPVMVVLPAGKFMMGDEQDGTLPSRQVTLKNKFALGRSEVTEAQFHFFLQRTGYKVEGAREAAQASQNRPTVDIDWQAAHAYARWLSRHTGKRYRLPSDAEWAYAARAGRSTRYWWGDVVTDGCGKERLPAVFFPYGSECASAPVEHSLADAGSMSPNPFGLYDMLGNAGEWVQDCWSDNGGASLSDGRANADCSKYGSPLHIRRVISFGGSAALRESDWLVARSPEIGFRVVRELP